ncbi:hypothetical protein OnM2_015019 [Erysiphe neolycopersici]|uniref:Uncharacterized protein n=1 Tax=Erysiphe neolycopersici TaxID=212602 RepID=A0A420I554_9PEZI|nr:hypothetical protein OnM2_015019 [Erysiphe neolycopersici]
MANRTAEIPSPNVSPNGRAAFTPEQLSNMMEYEKIVQFRNSILAGTHPRVRIHAHPELKSTRPDLSSNSHPKSQLRSYSPNKTEKTPLLHEEQITQSTSSSINFFSASRPAMSKNSEINPILLEKSDDLIKAEIQLQRQRLERGLREQVEHQRLASKVLLQTSELLPDFDVSEALSIALAIVPPAGTAMNESPTARRSPGSNSSDNNTFYSSLCNSPTPTASLEGQRIACNQIFTPGRSEWSSTQYMKNIEGELVTSSVPSGRIDNHAEQNDRVNSSLQTSVKTKELQLESKANHYGVIQREKFRERERPVTMRLDSRDAGNINFRKETKPFEYPTERTSDLHQKYLRQGLHKDHVPTHIRNLDLPLIAPQPERVSPLPTASESLILGAMNGRQPAQITTLRHLPTFSSADSSPRVMSREKRREKKKRRVKDTNTPNSPHIKSEPKSPSFNVPFPPPQKRKRDKYDSELNFERLRHSSNIPSQERMIETSYWPHRPQEQDLPYEPAGYESHYRQNEDINSSQRISSALPIHRPQSPQYSISHLPSGARPRAVSNLVGGKYLDDRDYASEPMPRASARPNVDRERTRSPPHHNIQSGALRPYLVDEHNRQYLSSTPAPVIGNPATSTARYRDENIGHERVPIRTVSSRMPLENYENDEYLRRRNSPPYTAYRRVITQPEYLTSPLPSQRNSRQRAYSVYPTRAASPYGEDKDRYRAAPDYQQMSQYEEPPREYLRATTMRPETSKYEIPREYITQYARPESHFPGQELRREMLPLGSREFNGPAVDPLSQSQWKGHPIEKYHDIAPKIFSHAEHSLGHEGSNYYNEPPGRRPFNDNDQERADETSRYEDRYRRRTIENGVIESARLRGSSVYHPEDTSG